MSIFHNFNQRVKFANPRFNEKKSSLKYLYKLIRLYDNKANLKDILKAFRCISAQEKHLYNNALHFLLNFNFNFGCRPPNNFQPITPKLAGMSKFDLNKDKGLAALWLYRNNYRTVISLEKDGASTTKKYTNKTFPNFKWYSCFLADWNAPSAEQLNSYCERVQVSMYQGGVVTHCWGGTGRTGCFLAAWLIYADFARTAEQALTLVRRHYNIHSVEMKIQYNALARFSDYLNNRPSKRFDQFITIGKWEEKYENIGLNHDPNHAGVATGKIAKNIHHKIVSHKGCSDGIEPYITTSPSARVQQG